MEIKGIDVSSWQGKIDWKTVSDYGMGFAILRITEKGNKIDSQFENNYGGCTKYNIPVGVYKYSYATTISQIKDEANIVIKTLNNIYEIFGNRKIAIVREISKKYEEVIRGTVENLLKTVENIKGEIVIVVEGNQEKETFNNLSIKKHVSLYIEDGLTPNEAIKKVAKERNVPKSKIYNEYHDL